VTPADIRDVSDTAIWVAHYRAVETARPDALFKDALAASLVGPRGPVIAESMKGAFRYIQWSVVMRTVVIDRLILKLVGEGVDTVINLGAGLDTRPYRLALPESLRWVEVDYPSVVAHKRIALDLADLGQRRELFTRLGAEATNALVVTEGVIPYLTEEQVASLADDLHAQATFRFWIAEYFAPEMYRHFRSRGRSERLRNAPFRFFPADWLGLFTAHGWTPREIEYLAEETIRVGRAMPLPLWARLFLHLAPRGAAEKHRRLAGYVVYTPVEPTP
jgi:methyltransferase (TIGR00027 family)